MELLKHLGYVALVTLVGAIFGVRWLAPYLRFRSKLLAEILFGACLVLLIGCDIASPYPLRGQTVDTVGWTRDSTSALDTVGWSRDSTPIVTWRFDSNAVTAIHWTFDSTPVTQPHPIPSAAHPNEPAGFQASRALFGTVIPTWPQSTMGAALGSWYAYPAGGGGNLSVVGGALQARFPAGWTGGKGPVNFGGYDATKRELSQVYVSYWIRTVGPDFENQATGTKVGFLAHGEGSCVGENESTFFLDNGTGAQAIQSTMLVQFKQQCVASRNLNQNVNRARLFTAGSWHHFEAVASLNAIGQSDGTFAMWIDGQLTHQYANVVYRTVTAPHGFSLFKFNPTWGGSGGVKTRTDYLQVRDIYLSGVP